MKLCYKLLSLQIDENKRPRLSLVDVDGLYETPAVVTAPQGGAMRAWPTDKEAV